MLCGIKLCPVWSGIKHWSGRVNKARAWRPWEDGSAIVSIRYYGRRRGRQIQRLFRDSDYINVYWPTTVSHFPHRCIYNVYNSKILLLMTNVLLLIVTYHYHDN